MGRTQILVQVVKIERIISATPVSKFRVYMHAQPKNEYEYEKLGHSECLHVEISERMNNWVNERTNEWMNQIKQIWIYNLYKQFDSPHSV